MRKEAREIGPGTRMRRLWIVLAPRAPESKGLSSSKLLMGEQWDRAAES